MYLKHGKYEVELKKIFSEKKVFLSYEGLISWDPIYWDYSINRLHLLTGSCVKIIVGFRQNESYFKSIYKQALASDVRRLPDSFFIDDLSKGREAIYSNISFSKSHYKPKILIEKLEKYFNSVLSFQLENDGLNLFKKEFNITFDNPPRVNISYTTFGLNIMLLRVKFLSLFKLKGFEYFHKWGDFKINEISPINYHPVSPAIYNKGDKEIRKISNLIMMQKNKLALIPFSSSFIISAKRI